MIRDSMGVIMCTYSAPVDVSNSNEGEVFALLVVMLGVKVRWL